MLPNDLSTVSYSDLQLLVANEVPESRHLEYKLHLPGPDWREAKFLETVASFANDGAGDMLLGISARDGIPTEIVGCDVSNVDAEVLRLDQLIRDRLDPTYRQHRIKPVPLPGGMVVFVIRMPLSFSRPHRVGSSGAIVGRGAAGKVPLDMSQVRQLILESHGFEDKVREFRSNRVKKLTDGHGPVPMSDGPIFVAHIVPLQSVMRPVAREAPDMDIGMKYFYPMLTHSGLSFDYNLEGTVFWDRGSDVGYAHIYRTGIIEGTLVFTHREVLRGIQDEPAPDRFVLSLEAIGDRLLAQLPKWLSGLSAMDVGPPYFLLLSMCRLGNSIAAGDLSRGIENSVPDRNTIEVPDVELPWPTENLSEALRMPLDILSQAFGRRRSYNFNEDGSWDNG